MIAHDKRPGNTSGLVKGPRPGWCDGPGWPVGGGNRADPRSDVATRTLPRPGCPGMGRGAHLRVVNLSRQRFPARGSRTSRPVLYLQPELRRTPYTRSSQNSPSPTFVNKTRRAGTYPRMDPGPSRYVALRRRRTAALRALRVVRGELPLPSPERPSLPERPPLRSNVSPPDPRHPGGVHPLALRLACGIGLRVALCVASPAFGFAPAPLGLLGAAKSLLEAPHRFPRLSLGLLGPALGLLESPLRFLRLFLGLLGSFLGLLGPAFGFTGPFFRFRSPPLGYADAPLGLLGLALGRAPDPFGLPGPRLGLLGSRLGLLGPRYGLLDVSTGLIGAPLGPRGAPLVEGEHGVEEVHVVVRGHPREVPSGLLREPLLAGQLPRHLRGAPGLGAEVADHGVEEVLDLPGAHLLGRHGVVGCGPIRCHQGIGELLGRPVYPLLLLVVHSALPPVLRALTGRWYPSRPPARGTPRRKPPACGPSPR